MGVTSISNEFNCPIPPARIFKAAILDAHNLLPKILPDKIKSIQIHVDGGAGSIKQINLADDGPFDFIKHRIEELDEQNFKCKFTLIEGAVIGEKIEKVVDTVQFVASADGGSICKATSEFYTIGDYMMGEDEIQMGKEMATGTFKLVEGYLLQNPDTYA
ncbi:major allergen Pru ar 1-like [Telopea speciosissima]|uniref:major allergen Pru ar 1-like n=1 Tax=Telopea speciosissima TaxID=54955 RepID=UPI001CC52A8D|nr:major allergen Pru ar 1-like [Telopea speciosissima]